MHIFSDLKTCVLNAKRFVAAVAVSAAIVGLAGTTTGYAAGGTTLGAQAQNIATEFSSAGGFIGSTAMYVAALICFIAGVWFLWQSRMPENRESGKVAAGLTGLVLTGLFAAGGSWIGKASQTTTGGASSITSTAGVITFQ